MDESSSSTPLPRSPYAAELGRGPGVRPFGAPLEAEYVRRRSFACCPIRSDRDGPPPAPSAESSIVSFPLSASSI
jgi:hypothetical protein